VQERQHNGQKKKDKITKSDLQNTTQKTIGRATRNKRVIQEYLTIIMIIK
jgi:hypothetical protein